MWGCFDMQHELTDTMFILYQAVFKVLYISKLIYSLAQPFGGRTILDFRVAKMKAQRDLVTSPRSHS